MPPPRILAPTDLLYRRLDPYPGFWDRDSLIANALAFLDAGKPYTKLSFGVVKHYRTPAAFLEQSGRFEPIRRMCGTGENNPAARQMWDRGFGIAQIPVQLVIDLVLAFDVRDGHQYNERGHADVLNGQSKAAAFAFYAYVLSESEIFPEPPPLI